MKRSVKPLILALGLAGACLMGLADAATASTTANANLRRIPSAQGQVMQVVPTGTLLTVACTGGEWCRTTYQGRGGYIARLLLRPVTGSAALTGPGNVYYASCARMRAAGAAPIRVGRPGYRTGLDSNRNSVACDRADR